MAFQLQPQPADPDKWIALGQREGFSLEVMDFFSMPLIAQPDRAEVLARFYRDTGMVTALHGAFMDVNVASGDPEFRALSRRRCMESCRRALDLGARNVVLHSSAFPFLRGKYLEHWASVCGEFYQELCDRFPVKLHIENAQDLDPEPLRLLMDRIDNPDIGVCLDLGHARYSHAPMEAWFDSLGERISYLHLSDNLGAFDDHLSLGSGSIHWQQAHSLWQQLGREVPITLETGDLSSTEDSIRFLREYGLFGMGENHHG